jgi:dihydroflavonol-4-reductase
MTSRPTVAVTGAAGFIGSAVVRKLLEQRRRVRAILEPGGRTENLDGLPVEHLTCDVTDFAGMRKALEGCESLFHLAALYKTWLPDEEIIHRVNIEGTVATLLAAQAAKVKRIVYTSSIAALVTKIDPADQKISLSVRALSDREQRETLKRMAAQQAATQTTTFGDLLKEKLAAKDEPEAAEASEESGESGE